MNAASTKIQNTMNHLQETGIISRTSDLISSAKSQMDSFGNEDGINGQDLRNMSIATRDMFVSIRELMSELTITVAAAKNSETLFNVQDTIKQAFV